MSKYLFDVQEKNRLQQKGLLKRFSIDCFGSHHTIQEIRAEKAEMYKKFKKMKIKSGKNYEWYFLKYTPGTSKAKTTRKNTRKKKKKRKKKKRGTRKLLEKLF